MLAVIGAVAAQPPRCPQGTLSLRERCADLEEQLRLTGLAYGTGAQDEAVELVAEAGPGQRAFAHLVAGIVRLCARAAVLSNAQWFVPGSPAGDGVRARRAQLLAVLAAAAGEAEAAARLFADPTATPSPLEKLAARTAARLSRRYLAESGPFAGLPLHNGLCAIEVRTCVMVALSAFHHRRISPAGAVVAARAALSWRVLLVELLAGLARAQEDGGPLARGIEQVIRSQRLPVREARWLRRALQQPRPAEQVAAELHGAAQRRFMLTHVLLAALVDDRLDAGELNFVERLSSATRTDAAALSQVEAEVAAFYREHGEALTALRLAEAPEGLPHALTTRLESIVLDNLDRLLQEIRETRELGELLAKATAGTALSAAEKTKVREQLLDLAKTIPALAIFAAPGGMLLLPILLKLLPFNLLPSSFVDPPPPLPALPEARRKSG
ncbi:MAG TPA: LETM1 domain-containing protein [Myxococcales bacterium]|nr:LETM1 domain-containing protein [Myxococcales bacterium]